MRKIAPRLTVSLVIALVMIMPGVMAASAHGGKDTEDGVYKVAFGANPEPVVTDSALRIEFRVNLNADNSLVSGITDAQIALAKEGQPIKTFAAAESSASRRGQGWYDTEVIMVTQSATYQATITFTAPNGKKYTMESPWEVKARSTLSVTGPTEVEAAIGALTEEVEHADEAADAAQDGLKALQARIDALEADVNALNPKTGGTTLNHAGSWTSPVAVVGLIAGVIAIAGAGFAVSRANNRH